MLQDKLEHYRIILASGSPRRQEFLKNLQLDYEVRVKKVNEVYPENLKGKEISDYLAALKASAYAEDLIENEIVITSDTVVWHNKESLAKPADDNEAYLMLKTLSNDWHKVITSVCFTTKRDQKIINSSTKVKFKTLTDEEIWFYINNYKPFDKAGGYGIQEWIGAIGVERIKGSYNNVMGLPTHLVYKTLITMVS
ncbi:MAG: Maf family nucleotide pyrophosphatase [Bacteroidota bacterium]